jgi:transcriptional regulator with XRE-family HTH domain
MRTLQTDEPVNPMAERLRREMERQRITPLELSKRASVGRSFVYDMLNGKSCNPTAKKIQAVARALDVSVPYLIQGDCRAGDIEGRDGYVPLGELSSDGAVVSPRDGKAYFLPCSVLRSGGNAEEGLLLFRVDSDEMAPTIDRFDVLLIAPEAGGDFSAGVYAVRDGRRAFIRRLDRVYKKGRPYYLVQPDNRNYRSYEATEEDISVVGRVVWRAGAL